MFRHNPDGYRQALINLDEGLHESQFAEWPNMCAIMEKVVVFLKNISEREEYFRVFINVEHL